MAEILIIDDENAFREGLIETLSDLGEKAIGVSNVREGLKLIQQKRFKAIFVDFKMPEIDGLKAIELIQEELRSSPVPIVMITAYIDSSNTIEAMKLGAFDHLTKPIGRKDIAEILESIEKAFPQGDSKKLPCSSLDPIAAGGNLSDTLIGASPAIRKVLKMIGRLSTGDSSVLITGDTGTGKELVARSIHQNSERKSGPFIAVNCAAIPEALLESELFGHIKGAFTGAASDRKGSFQLADGGTLLLDEIGDMDLTLQAKLLRALQEREVTPVGASKPIKINVRFLAATHRNLLDRVKSGDFREDLYYRLNVIELDLPSLEERPEDIRLLADHFLNQIQTSGVKKVWKEEALSKLEGYTWPGNIRELRNVVERAAVVARGHSISADDIRFNGQSATPEDVPGTDGETLDLHLAVSQLERRLITRALKEAKGNRSEAARKLGIQRQLLYSKIREYEL